MMNENFLFLLIYSICAGAWVYLDAKERGQAGASLWGFFAGIFWYGLPIYLLVRFRKKPTPDTPLDAQTDTPSEINNETPTPELQPAPPVTPQSPPKSFIKTKGKFILIAIAGITLLHFFTITVLVDHGLINFLPPLFKNYYKLGNSALSGDFPCKLAEVDIRKNPDVLSATQDIKNIVHDPNVQAIKFYTGTYESLTTLIMIARYNNPHNAVVDQKIEPLTEMLQYRLQPHRLLSFHMEEMPILSVDNDRTLTTGKKYILDYTLQGPNQDVREITVFFADGPILWMIVLAFPTTDHFRFEQIAQKVIESLRVNSSIPAMKATDR